MGDLVPGLLATDNAVVAFKGFYDPENSFNGWASAYFDRATTEQIIAWVEHDNQFLQKGFQTHFRWAGEVLLMSEEQYDVTDYPITPNAAGLYQVASGWTWEPVRLPLDATTQQIHEHLTALRG
jgi:hypothetical protein